MSSIDDEKMIQAFFPDRADPAFGEGVCIGSPDRNGDDLQVFRLENSSKCSAETAVIVIDQEPQGLFSIGKFPNQMPGLLSNPKLIRVSRDTGKMDTPRTQFDEEEHIDSLRPDSFDGEKVTGQDLFFVVSHQVTPANRTIANLCGLDAVTVENVANGWLRNLETQLDELALDFAVSPARVSRARRRMKFSRSLLIDGRPPLFLFG